MDPFVVAHNLLRAHAFAFSAWRASPTKRADSLCGITLNGDWATPLNASSPADVAAAQRDMEYQMAIFMDPIYYGRWPQSVVQGAGSALPPLDATLIKDTHVGVYFQNHYTSHYSWANPAGGSGYLGTANVSTSGYRHGVPIGLPSSNGWLFEFPPGLAYNQNWLHARYPEMAFIVTENGWGNQSTSQAEDLNDLVRCNFYRSYLGNMSANAHASSLSVLGFFAWSVMDNYEWADGFSTRFGLTFVDFDTNERTPKLSLRWFGNVTRQFTTLPVIGQDAFPLCESFLAEL